MPTPGTLVLMGAGLLGLSLRRRRWVLRRFV
ncbi:MAG: PEP-CTERM sorting domain-containing protein [Gammaproteobacteria bacterium]|nr:PEP-CTERM sorting domain-containing protein [Gammaproteobacteria bacterium]